jgi:ligand-binding sensor domain-containing protein
LTKRFLLLLLVFIICKSVAGQAVSYRFTHLGTSDGIANNSITDITQDSKGYMWFATLNGLQRYDGYRFNNYHFEFGNERSLPSDVVAKILEDDKGNIWAACNNGVAIINQVRQKPKRVPFETKAALQLEVTQFFQDSKKNIWLTSRPNGAFIYDNKTRRFIEANKVLPPFNWTIFLSGKSNPQATIGLVATPASLTTT